MKTIILLLLLACAGCASSRFNHDYARSTLPTNDIGYGLPQSPHSF